MPRTEDDDDLLETVTKMADRLKLKGRDREKYVHEHMTRGGYRAVPRYVRDDDGDDDEGGSFFSSRSRGRSRRRNDDDDEW
jgi:hypothetical protein